MTGIQREEVAAALILLIWAGALGFYVATII
jgi:hypothetical protein